LVQNFAAQAVIAIENTRLLNELRQRTDDLSKSLEQQTATSEVLQVISTSPGDLQPVFQAMLENATRLCGAKFGTLYLYDGDAFHATAFHNTPPALMKERQRAPVRPNPNTLLGRMVRTRRPALSIDLAAEQGYLERDPGVVASVELGGIRTLLTVPLLKENEPIGALSIYRQEVRPFTDKQVELVKSFANQAVIAIENTRLLNELRQRTDDLSESLEQQTATSEVLGVISKSPGDLEPVFNAMLENAVRLCEAKFGNLLVREGDVFRIAALHGAPMAYAERWRWEPTVNPRDIPHPPLARVAETKAVVHISDLAAEPAYIERNPRMVAIVESA